MSSTEMNILVVDDDPAVRDALKFSLELEGFKVHACRDGWELLAHGALRDSDCIVLDYRMPGLDGLSVLNQLAMRKVEAPVILITGPIPENLRSRALRAGARLVLEKPLLDGVLTDKIRELTH
ncbi:MAG: response regulator [Alphaproteobacteria bacterium]|nr:response regulator [Alphaproteobacteria bacterium]